MGRPGEGEDRSLVRRGGDTLAIAQARAGEERRAQCDAKATEGANPVPDGDGGSEQKAKRADALGCKVRLVGELPRNTERDGNQQREYEGRKADDVESALAPPYRQ